MNIWDTASGAEHDVMRPLVYQGADLIIICYSTVDVQSFYNVANKVSDSGRPLKFMASQANYYDAVYLVVARGLFQSTRRSLHPGRHQGGHPEKSPTRAAVYYL